MSDAARAAANGSGPGSSNSIAVEFLAGLVIVIEFGLCFLIIFVLKKDISIPCSYGAISLIALSFIGYLFGIYYDREGRSFFVAIIFIVSNISSIILLFANVYRWVGLTDTLRPGYPCPSQICAVHFQLCDDLKICQITSIWDGIYFSLITLTTVGYGDVTPTLHARSTAAFEAITGYVIMGLVISVLITLAKPSLD